MNSLLWMCCSSWRWMFKETLGAPHHYFGSCFRTELCRARGSPIQPCRALMEEQKGFGWNVGFWGAWNTAGRGNPQWECSILIAQFYWCFLCCPSSCRGVVGAWDGAQRPFSSIPPFPVPFALWMEANEMQTLGDGTGYKAEAGPALRSGCWGAMSWCEGLGSCRRLCKPVLAATGRFSVCIPITNVF